MLSRSSEEEIVMTEGTVTRVIRKLHTRTRAEYSAPPKEIVLEWPQNLEKKSNLKDFTMNFQ